MKHRLVRMLLALFVVAGLALALRQDSLDLALFQGNVRLGTGDAGGGQAAFARAVSLGADPAPLAYNLGVALYRKGEYLRAGEQFTAALATGRPKLAIASHYNLGNCQFRRAERLAAGDPEAARRSFQAAVANYERALVLAPDAADVAGNLSLARVRIATLGAGQDKGRGHGEKERNTGADAAEKSPAGNNARTETSQARPAASLAAKGAAGSGAHADPTPSAGRTRRDLTRNEAERLLNEARGRERPVGMPQVGNPAGRQAKPDMDW